VTPPARGAGNVDLLTHTTLHMDEGLSMPTIAQLIKALQRVPGVLLAEIAAGSACAIVAHDAAVPGASLLAAAEQAGVHAIIVADTPLPTPSDSPAPPLAEMSNRRRLMYAAALLVLWGLGQAIFPRLASNHFLLPILFSAVWAFVIARAMFKRRQ
jgi:hypothetical protein